ncbi:MAG: M23 family metallopeptidase [Candidatus Eremiobacteraeota bacterium]|nr:M23 family metallopeptidase [Candidatus Eremiobacteraeota bacterium]MBC5826937.1 M23 family metallopeptidase [Candidatus Eremiobacteraeota bacterium]
MSFDRLPVSHLHVAIAAVCAIVFLASTVAFSVGSVRASQEQAQAQRLRAVDDAQHHQLIDLTRKTDQAWQRLRQLQRSDEEIRRLTAAAARAYHVRLPSQGLSPASHRPVQPGGQTPPRTSAEPTSRTQPTASLWGRLASWFAGISGVGGTDFAEEGARLSRLTQDLDTSFDRCADLRAQALAIVDARRSADVARQRYLDAIPSIWPTSGSVSSGFGYRTDPESGFHAGLDIENDYGAPVYATAAGVVSQAGWDGDYGNKLIIDHGNGLQTWYAHNSQLLVFAGQQVRKGQEIARVGATGFATGPHVHYEVLLWGKPIDPTPYLNGVRAQVASAR